MRKILETIYKGSEFYFVIVIVDFLLTRNKTLVSPQTPVDIALIIFSIYFCITITLFVNNYSEYINIEE